ncbi:MAG: molybdenum ABC transporter ATP-binding protein [Bradyrhizobiaceae bacterium]|nr:molybdenum ABC transporter ATP-binding protein [Bradyrhizobiaceae bacterium]
MTLEVDVTHQLGAFSLDVRFTSEGRLTALFGQSGSGKTSLINIISGVIRPDRGRVVIDGTALVDTANGIFVPTWRRRIGCVFQEGRLFPHLTVRQNLTFGRRFRSALEHEVRLDTVVKLLDIADLLQRRPGALSGGEKQRVAIGRAFLSAPRLLLMDEPLAALDEARKEEIEPYIETLRDEYDIPIVYVSHSLKEVSRLANAVVVLNRGQVVATGDPAEVLSRADLVPNDAVEEAGALIAARVFEHDTKFNLTMLESGAGPMRVPRLDLPIGTSVRVRLRARDVMVATAAPVGLSALNIFPGHVLALRRTGEDVEVIIDCSGVQVAARLTRKSTDTLGLAAGMPVYAIVKAVTLDRGTLAKSPLSASLRGADLGVRSQQEIAAARPGKHER